MPNVLYKDGFIGLYSTQQQWTTNDSES